MRGNEYMRYEQLMSAVSVCNFYHMKSLLLCTLNLLIFHSILQFQPGCSRQSLLLSASRPRHDSICLYIRELPSKIEINLHEHPVLRHTKMTYIETWEEFSKAAERLYLQNPWKVRPVVTARSFSSDLRLSSSLSGSICCEVSAL